MTNADVVRTCMESYLAQDRDTAEKLIAKDFVFTSPQDDHIDRATFFEHCFPTVDRLKEQRTVEVIPTQGDDVFIMYEYELKAGGRYRNVELSTVRDGKIVEIQVFFGGQV